MKIHVIVQSAVYLVCLALLVKARSPLDYACDPRKSEASCLLGCLACFEHYGSQMYNMAACCQECRDTQAALIDDGEKCSQRFIRVSWMRRFGRDTSAVADNKPYQS